MQNPVLFSGTSNKPLATAISSLLHLRLGDVEITRFIDNECRVYVKDDVSGRDVFVIESLSTIADQHLVELCLLGAALKDLHAAKVTAVIPWMGYSKQDKAFRKGEAVSAQLVAKFIEVAGFDRVIACELHSETVVPYFHIPLIELSTHQLLADKLKAQGGWEGAMVASPDKGGKSRSEKFAQSVGLPIVYLGKTRDLSSGEVTVTGMEGDVTGHPIIIFDDIINTGATAIKTTEFLKRNGAQKIYFLATHAVLAGDAVRLLSPSVIDQIIVTDTVVIPPEKHFAKLTIVSAAPLFADAIKAASQ